MKQLQGIAILIGILCCHFLVSSEAASVSSHKRERRAAYALPDGVEFYVGEIRTGFKCPGDGYYADPDNDCKLFHVCVTQNMPDGSAQQQHYTFACGNQTVFNQFSLTCSYEDESVPCREAADFYYLNDLLGQGPDVPLHTDQDVDRAALYGNRISATNRGSREPETASNRS